MLALEQPALGPDTFARFPRSLRAAVREVLLIAAHGKGIQVGCWGTGVWGAFYTCCCCATR